jgi:hypothetical protein
MQENCNSVVLCGNLTIPNYEKYFHCFLIVTKVKLRHSPGGPSRSDFVQLESVTELFLSSSPSVGGRAASG